LTEVEEPQATEGSILVQATQLGICGTDFDLIAGDYGWAPPNSNHLILGHESFGRVLQAPPNTGFEEGDLVIGIVRRPDPHPCSACSSGEWDMCLNGRYTERGIKERHGFGAERWRIEPEFAIKVDAELGQLGILVEPASVLAKAWEQIEHIGQRAHWKPRIVLVTGAGPIGLLAALMAKQRGFDVYVLDRVSNGPKPDLVKRLGATYYSGNSQQLGLAPDIVIECTGAASVIEDTLEHLGGSGIFCMVGSCNHAEQSRLDIRQWNLGMVLKNQLVFGVVNANRRHFEKAADALKRADRTWLQGLITRREPLANWQAAFKRQAQDVKVVIDF
jgi:threonine dehydrogenase-like Zn-dependent dehydrogenase